VKERLSQQKVDIGKTNGMKAEQWNKRAETIFISSVVFTLVLTALAKLISTGGGSRGLHTIDALLILAHREVGLSVFLGVWSNWRLLPFSCLPGGKF
jgi:hypothetical protein